jgi:hypothetical protein
MQVEFRDGIREVPDYLAILMRGLPTYDMTYEEARDKANWKMATDFANKVQLDIQRKALRSR